MGNLSLFKILRKTVCRKLHLWGLSLHNRPPFAILCVKRIKSHISIKIKGMKSFRFHPFNLLFFVFFEPLIGTRC
jgi:hypothetical protein